MHTPAIPALSALPDRLCLPLAFDPARLLADIAEIADADWIAHFVPGNYEGGWSVIPLRCTAGAGKLHPILMIQSDPVATEFESTPWLERAPYLTQVLAAFQCPLLAVRLMRLEPASRIKPHRDLDLDAARGTARLHVPITTNPDVDFRLNQQRVDMAPGSTWYLRLADEHAITNAGTATRVHLVIDCAVDEWLTDLLKQAAASPIV